MVPSHTTRFISRTQWRAVAVIQARVRGVVTRRILAGEKARLETEADARATGLDCATAYSVGAGDREGTFGGYYSGDMAFVIGVTCNQCR